MARRRRAGPAADSGKFARLREIREAIAARQEKALVFTQFREIDAAAGGVPGDVFGRPGLVLHGGTPVKQRAASWSRGFQDDEARRSSCCRSRPAAPG